MLVLTILCARVVWLQCNRAVDPVVGAERRDGLVAVPLQVVVVLRVRLALCQSDMQRPSPRLDSTVD